MAGTETGGWVTLNLRLSHIIVVGYKYSVGVPVPPVVKRWWNYTENRRQDLKKGDYRLEKANRVVHSTKEQSQ